MEDSDILEKDRKNKLKISIFVIENFEDRDNNQEIYKKINRSVKKLRNKEGK